MSHWIKIAIALLVICGIYTAIVYYTPQIRDLARSWWVPAVEESVSP